MAAGCRIGLQAGETTLVNGATGGFGSAAVAVALALGASVVVATGRNAQALDGLVRRFGPRVRTVVFSGDEDRDREAMQAAAGAPIDAVFDILPPAADPRWARAAIMAVRMNGRAVLMGGIGMQGGGGLDIPYAWLMRNGIALYGQWMYDRDAIPRMAALIRVRTDRSAQFRGEDVRPRRRQRGGSLRVGQREPVAHYGADAGWRLKATLCMSTGGGGGKRIGLVCSRDDPC